MYGQLADIGLSAIRKITDLWSGAKADSLIDYTRVARVEPIVLIDNDCLYLESLPEVMQSLQSVFAGYYLQAIAISTNVGKVEVMRHLDKLNPNRKPLDSAMDSAGWLLAQESYRHRLPRPNDARIALEASDRPFYKDGAQIDADNNRAHEKNLREWEKDRRELEAHALNMTVIDNKSRLDQAAFVERVRDAQRQYDQNVAQFGHQKAMDMAKQDLAKAGLALNEKQFKLQQQDREDRLSAHEISIGRDTLQTIKELSNLSVGKMLSVEITDGLHRASIPVSIRLIASAIPSQNIVHILSIGNEDTSVKERYHAWKSGRLEFVRDLVFCQDLIDAHRKNLMADKDGIYANLIKRHRSNQLSTVVSGNPSVATASNLVVVSSDTASQLELKINGRLKDFKTREKLFKDTYVMIMVVIDKQWERATFYHRGIDMHTEVGMRDLKIANKGSGPDVSDILKAYQMGTAPSL
jgi:hypothetical protein